MNEVIRKVFDYKGANVTFASKDGLVMVNATEMAKRFGKQPSDWTRQKSSKAFMTALMSARGIPRPTDLVRVTNGNNGSTWMHEDVAIEFARWLSPEFAIWCNDRVKELMKYGITATPQTIETIINDPDNAIRLLQEIKKERKEKEALAAKNQQQQLQIEAQSEQLKEQKPKVAFADAVADSEGNIIISAIYAKTIKLLRMPLLVYVLPEGMAEKAEHYFSLKYGEFNYDHIERNTYIQSYAQPERHPEGADKHALSVLYETQVIPNVTKATRILDFGAGCKNYYEMLKGKGYDIDAIEFFYCGPKMLRSKILTEQVERDCKEICAHLEKYGRYDVVVCDHVINSVDSLEAEAAVLRTCSALCKPGGTIYWAGNTVYGATSSNQTENSKRKRGTFAFLDEDKFTANYMNGVWYFQHYHSMADICECNKKYIGKTFNVFDNGTLKDKDKEIKSGTFEVVAVNEIPAPPSELLDAVRFEFTLPLPEGKRYDLDKYIIPVLEKLLK